MGDGARTPANAPTDVDAIAMTPSGIFLGKYARTSIPIREMSTAEPTKLSRIQYTFVSGSSGFCARFSMVPTGSAVMAAFKLASVATAVARSWNICVFGCHRVLQD
jgi:hypothetical protein